jgi:hypothetical protein
MGTWHGYFAIEDPNLLPVQRATLIAELKALGPVTHRSPACLNHRRTRLDGNAAIFEALFDEDTLTIAAFKNRLASIFLVNPDSIDHTLAGRTFDTLPTPVVTFSRTGTDYLRMALLGRPAATWAGSIAECRAYLALYADQWEEAD